MLLRCEGARGESAVGNHLQPIVFPEACVLLYCRQAESCDDQIPLYTRIMCPTRVAEEHLWMFTAVIDNLTLEDTVTQVSCAGSSFVSAPFGTLSPLD
eukprot:m.548950 g.548950  ORF g.548950 m.548950 type:complete len:98 (-) comp57719_c0_seq12:247-540(-)